MCFFKKKKRYELHRERKQLLPEELNQQGNADWLSGAGVNETLSEIAQFDKCFNPT